MLDRKVISKISDENPPSENLNFFPTGGRSTPALFLPEDPRDALYYLKEGVGVPFTERDIERLEEISLDRERCSLENRLHYLRFAVVIAAAGVALGFVASSYESSTKLTIAGISIGLGNLVSSGLGSFATHLQGLLTARNKRGRHVIIQRIAERYRQIAQNLVRLKYDDPAAAQEVASRLFKKNFYDQFSAFDLEEQEMRRIAGVLYETVHFVCGDRAPQDAQLQLAIDLEKMKTHANEIACRAFKLEDRDEYAENVQ